MDWEQQVEQAERRNRAKKLLKDTDFVVVKAHERGRQMSEDWLAWREQLRLVAKDESDMIPDEPERAYRGAASSVAPADLADLIDWAAPPKDRQEALLAKLREVSGLIGLAEDRGGRAEAALYRKRDRIESGLRYNRATSVEEL